MSSLRSIQISNARALFHWAFICIVAPVAVIAPVIHRSIASAAWLPLVVILYSGTRLSRIAHTGANCIVELTFWVYIYVFFGLSAFLQVAVNHFPWGGTYSSNEILRANLIVLLGMVAFDLGYRGFHRQAWLDTPPNTAQRALTIGRMGIVIVLALAASTYATWTLGGFAQLFLNRTDRFQFIAQTYDIAMSSLYGAMAKTGPYVMLVLVLAYLTKERRQRTIFTLTAILLGVWALVENNPVATARFQVGTLILALYFVFPWKPAKVRLAIYVLIVGLVVVFPYADLFRTGEGGNLDARIERYQQEPPLIYKVDYDSFQQVMNGARAVDRAGFQYGRQLFGSVFFWFPRSVWHDKPQPTGVLIAQLNGYGFTNLSSPLWIEFYVDGGWVLLLIGFAAYGFMARTLDKMRQSSTSRTTAGYLFATIFAGYQVFLLRGSLMPALAYLSPVVPLLLLSTRRTWRPASSELNVTSDAI